MVLNRKSVKTSQFPMQEDINQPKPICKKCNIEFDFRVKRGPFVRTFLFWLPLKRYQCVSCLKRYYVLTPKVKDKKGIFEYNTLPQKSMA